MTRKWNLSIIAFVIVAMCSTSALAQDKPPSLDEAFNQIKSGLANAGTRTATSPSGVRIADTRRYQFIGAEGCSMQVLMEVDNFQGGRTSFSKFIETIPLSELDVSRIKARMADFVSGDTPIFRTGLTSSESSSRRTYIVDLITTGARKTITYVVERKYDWSSSVERSEGKGALFSISFKDKQAAEQVALAFAQAGRLCGAKEKSKR